MDDLAEELGVSKKTLYATFPTKEALLEAVVEHKYAHVSATLDALRRNAPRGFSERLPLLLSTLQRELAEIRPPFVRDMRRYAPHVFEKVERRRQKLIEKHFNSLFRNGQRSGDVRRDLPVRLIVETLLAAVHAIVNPQKVEDLNLEPKEAFAGVLELLLHGALRREGSSS